MTSNSEIARAVIKAARYEACGGYLDRDGGCGTCIHTYDDEGQSMGIVLITKSGEVERIEYNERQSTRKEHTMPSMQG